MRPPETMGCRFRAARGFTLFEFVVVICIIAIMATMLYRRLDNYQEGAERAMVEQTAGAVRSGLQMRVASMLIAGREGELATLATRNPTDFLTDKPRDYAGELADDTAIARLEPGSWFFDTRTRELVYLVNYDGRFTPGPDGRKWIRYRIVIEFEDAVSGKGFSAARLVATNPYSWK